MVNVALIGTGGIARKHMEALLNIKEAKIVSTYDVVAERAQAFAAECGATAETDLEKAIAKADLVYVLTPPSFHKEIAVKAMESGKHVVIEKPIAITLEDAKVIVETSRRTGKKAMMGFNMRYREGYRKLKEIVDSGRLGKILYYWSQRMEMVRPEGNWRTNPEQLSGFTIESLSHDIDMFRWISGSEVCSVYGDVQNASPHLPGYDDNALVVLHLADGSAANIQASWSSYLSFNSRGVVGTEGTAMISGTGTWNFDTFRYRTKEMEEECIEALDDPLDIRFLSDGKPPLYRLCFKRSKTAYVRR